MNDQRAVVEAAVAIVGGGPAGLTAATALRQRGIDRVIVLEREARAGGIPRHSDHTGYGIRDRRTILTGPVYAERLVGDALDWRVDLRTSATVTDWAGETSLFVTSPEGRLRVDAEAVVLATGARERPRSARLVAGDRPAGVLTTGLLQNLVHLHPEVADRQVGTRAVVVGSEQVSWSAVLTLRSAGCRTVLMTTEQERSEAYGAMTIPGRTVLGVPVSRRTRVIRIVGRERVEGVEVRHLDTGQQVVVACDTVVFTADWIPDNELVRLRGLRIDPGHHGAVVDTALRTSADGVFGAGNLLHPVDTADVAALDGRHVAEQVTRYLEGGAVPAEAFRLVAGDGFAWVAPGLIRLGDPAPPRGRLLLWPAAHRRLPRVVVEQDGRVRARRTIAWPLAAGRMFRLPSSLVDDCVPGAGDVTIRLA
jgi:thioredoxin reductase